MALPAPRRLLPAALVLAMAAAGLAALVATRRSSSPAGAGAAPAPLPTRIAALGRIEPLDRVVKVSLPSSLSNDAVRRILVEEGQQVRQGQPLAILDSDETLAQAVREAEARLAVAERKLAAQTSVIERERSELQQAQVELQRYSQLFSQGATSAETLDRRRTLVATAEANLQGAIADRDTLAAEVSQARATLERDRAERRKATILAPFSGTVFRIQARPGDRVGEEGLLELGDSSRMGVIAEVYQTDRPGIALGQRVWISADGFPQKVPGQVVAISRQVSRQTISSGDAGENQDRRVIEVKIALGPEAAAMASTMNYLQVNVLFDPLTPAQRQRQEQQRQLLIDRQRQLGADASVAPPVFAPPGPVSTPSAPASGALPR
ncbi:MAG: efflux RND transporter periplasmic adaptor subunit [Cyanobacteriota bacterium]|nr:efflux RND transporter periplasmic adaptor subunit [Cyanobacteriota bacterium]